MWTINFRELEPVTPALFKLLTKEDIESAAQFRGIREQHTWVIAHGALRSILGSYTGCAPDRLAFEKNIYGKPALRRPGRKIEFNLAHTRTRAMLVIAQRRVGVDVEEISAEVPVERLSRVFFCDSETAAILALPLERRHKAFFDCWTRKEALLKAMGSGLSRRLNSFELPAPWTASVRIVINEELRRWHWTIHDAGEPGFAAAVAAEVWPLKLKRFSFGSCAEPW